MRTRAALILSALVAGCGPDETPVDDGCDVPATALDVEVGTGLDEFEPITDGAKVSLIYGPQGGFHLWTAIRVRDVSAERVSVELDAVRDDGMRVGGSGAVTVVLVTNPDGTRVRTGLYAYVDVPSDAVGHRVSIAATVTACGEGRGRDSRVVVPEQP